MPKGTRAWLEVNWDGTGHRTPVNTELGTICRYCYPGMVSVGGRQVAAHSWSHWGLKQYADQGSFQEAVWNMFWVSTLAKF